MKSYAPRMSPSLTLFRARLRQSAISFGSPSNVRLRRLSGVPRSAAQTAASLAEVPSALAIHRLGRPRSMRFCGGRNRLRYPAGTTDPKGKVARFAPAHYDQGEVTIPARARFRCDTQHGSGKQPPLGECLGGRQRSCDRSQCSVLIDVPSCANEGVGFFLTRHSPPVTPAEKSPCQGKSTRAARRPPD